MINNIPITIGIIGHRDALLTEEHNKELTCFFKSLLHKYKQSPIYLFTSLAEGADRFVAQIVLDLKQQYPGKFELIVPLPFEIEEYKKDFLTEKSKQEFDDLITQAQKVFVVAESTQNRDENYFKAGKFIADSSLLLIALWDGIDNKKKGGTSDIINYKINGDINKLDHIFDFDEAVCVIYCQRQLSKQITENNDPNILLLNEYSQNISITQALNKIEEINSEACFINDSKLEISKGFLFKETNELNSDQNLLLNFYALLDSLALFKQMKNNVTIKLLFSLGLTFVTSFEIYKHMFLYQWVLGITISIIAAAFFIFQISKYSKYHIKYLDYRILAEALRIQFFWNLGGINKNVADYILRIHKKEYIWIKQILSAINGITYYNSLDNSEIDALNIIKSKWIEDQMNYFTGTIKNIEKQIRSLNLISRIALILGSLLLISLFFLEHYYKTYDILHPIIVAICILLGIFALIKAYIVKKGFDQIINQYGLMETIYSKSNNKINELEDLKEIEKIKELLFITGKEALIENGNWYLIFKEREPEIEGVGG